MEALLEGTNALRPGEETPFGEIVGESPALRNALSMVSVVAPTNSSVLILGETGTGKELVARAIHDLSGRRERGFVKLNCAAIPIGLLESDKERRDQQRQTDQAGYPDKHHKRKIILQDAGHRRAFFPAVAGNSRFVNWNYS